MRAYDLLLGGWIWTKIEGVTKKDGCEQCTFFFRLAFLGLAGQAHTTPPTAQLEIGSDNGSTFSAALFGALIALLSRVSLYSFEHSYVLLSFVALRATT